jgi:hypothetical protein
MENDPIKLQKFELVQEIAKLESMKLRLTKANEKLVSDIRRIRRITDINKSSTTTLNPVTLKGDQSAAPIMKRGYPKLSDSTALLK